MSAILGLNGAVPEIAVVKPSFRPQSFSASEQPFSASEQPFSASEQPLTSSGQAPFELQQRREIPISSGNAADLHRSTDAGVFHGGEDSATQSFSVGPRSQASQQRALPYAARNLQRLDSEGSDYSNASFASHHSVASYSSGAPHKLLQQQQKLSYPYPVQPPQTRPYQYSPFYGPPHRHGQSTTGGGSGSSSRTVSAHSVHTTAGRSGLVPATAAYGGEFEGRSAAPADFHSASASGQPYAHPHPRVSAGYSTADAAAAADGAATPGGTRRASATTIAVRNRPTMRHLPPALQG